MVQSIEKLQCMNVEAWRAYTWQEMLDYVEKLGRRAKRPETAAGPFGSVLAVRKHLSPVDMFCYLKARFGEPNGIQNWLRKDDSDNWIHWDFNLKAGNEDVYICGTYREVHLMVSETLTAENWRDLVLRIKTDYGRVGKEKRATLASLEKWVIFPNKFVEVANVCADLHAEITTSIRRFSPYRLPPLSSVQDDNHLREARKRITRHFFRVCRTCLELRLLTPVLAEVFINMMILMLCKKEIRNNDRQFEAFIRSQIDAKIFDLPYKCEGFKSEIDRNSSAYKNFKRVMDRRNHTIHGNVDPEGERVEVVYFEGKRPLFAEPGDHISKYFEALARQYEPEKVVKDYEDTSEFLFSIVGSLEPGVAKQVWEIIEDDYPGYDLNRKIMGVLLPAYVATAHVQGVPFDDELPVSWD